jgi:iron(III) transport system ATP-binding protein
MSAIEVVDAVKSFGPLPVLDRVDLSVPEGSLTAILGSSGSGKTTLLRIIAGFEQLDAGAVTIDGQLVDNARHTVHAQHRGVGYVPQDGALFPHLTAAGNVGFGLRRRDRGRALELLDLVGLGGLGGRHPHELSGGQQQRVALARALAIRPRVVLLDEPFASLDASLRSAVRRDVARILADAGTTTIIVTHDQDEALSMADQVAVLSGGRMLASAPPRELYAAPPNEQTANQLGEVNLLPASFSDEVAQCALGAVSVPGAPPATHGTLVVRPEQLAVYEKQTAAAVPAHVIQFEYYGHDCLARLRLDNADGTSLAARLAGQRRLRPGQPVWVKAEGPAFALPASA